MRYLIASILLIAATAAHAGQFSLTITYPDAEQTRIVTALRNHYCIQQEDGSCTTATIAQATESLRQSVRDAIRDLVLKYERDAAVKTATDAVMPVDTQ